MKKVDCSISLVNVPNELLFILKMIKNPALIPPKELNWHRYMEMALHHRLYPMLIPEMLENPHFYPPSIFKTLLNIYRENTFDMLYLSSEMEQVSKCFSERGIQSIFLKGPVLGDDLYGNLSMRTSCDLDVLVRMDNLESVDTILKEQGYMKNDYIDTILEDWKWRHHHMTYIHSQRSTKIEVHWRLHPGPGREPSFALLWNNRRVSPLTNFPVHMLGKEDLFYFLITHGSRHGWTRLRWLMDIHCLLNQEVNWEKVKDLITTYHAALAAGEALILANRLLDSTIPNELKKLTASKKARKLASQFVFYIEKMVNLHTEPLDENIADFHKKHQFGLMTFYNKLLFLFSTLHPYPIDQKTLPLPGYLHILYFPLRPFLFSWRRIKKLFWEKGVSR